MKQITPEELPKDESKDSWNLVPEEHEADFIYLLCGGKPTANGEEAE